MPSMATTFAKHGTRDTRSALQKALEVSDDPRALEFCPFGCTSDDQDERGYCRHLIGFTNAAIPEGEITASTRIPAGPDGEVETLGEPGPVLGRRSIQRGKNVPLKVGDHLVRITCSSRVYRREGLKPDAKKPTPAPAG